MVKDPRVFVVSSAHTSAMVEENQRGTENLQNSVFWKTLLILDVT